MLTILKANNPFALRPFQGSQFRGTISAVSGGSGAFIQFDKMENGVRAGFINLHNKVKSYPTLRRLFAVYAPVNDPQGKKNDPVAYAQTVAKKVGVLSIDAPIDTDPTFMYRLGQAVASHETGGQVPKEFNTGYNLYLQWRGLTPSQILQLGGLFTAIFVVGITFFLTR
jgi:hypothetical protein